jgi:hypothetical protein
LLLHVLVLLAKHRGLVLHPHRVRRIYIHGDPERIEPPLLERKERKERKGFDRDRSPRVPPRILRLSCIRGRDCTQRVCAHDSHLRQMSAWRNRNTLLSCNA